MEGEYFYSNSSQNGAWGHVEAQFPIPQDAVILGVMVEIGNYGTQGDDEEVVIPLKKRDKKLVPPSDSTPIMTDTISLAFYDEENDYLELVGENKAMGSNWTTTPYRSNSYGDTDDLVCFDEFF